MTNSLKIKICGVNDKNSMLAAIDAEADYIGLVFYEKSPRNLELPIAETLIPFRNNKSKIVALTVDAGDEYLNEIKEKISPDYFQLHGNETPQRCKEIKLKFNTPIIKGLGIRNKIDLNENTKSFENISDIMILDAPSSILPGGNGKQFDWNILKGYKSKSKWMLAGRLNIKNVQIAIEYTKAPGIDVSSGVEISKVIKDPGLIRDFITKCRKING